MTDTPRSSQVVSTKSLVEALMGAIVDGIITIDQRGAIQTVNPATERIFGYSEQELVGKNIKMLMPDPFQSEHDKYLHNYLTTGTKKIIGIGREVIGQRKNGECFPLELAISDMEVAGQTMFAGIIRDISERKQVENALITSNKRLALATEAGGVGVWDYDLITGNLVWDERMFEMYAVDKTVFSGLYDAWRNALHPEDLQATEALFQRSVEQGVPFDTTFRIIGPDKNIRYIEAHAQSIRNEHNEVQRIIGVNIDTTEAKQVAFEYQARENRIRALMDTIVDGILVINASGSILSINPAGERLFGYTQIELEGKNVKMLMPEPYCSAHDGFLRNYLTTGVKKIIGSGREVVGLRRDGSTFPMELAVSEAEVSGETLFTGIVRDISERKEVLDQLHLQSGALEAAANAILITNSEGIIQWANSAFTRLTGYSDNEVKGKSTRMLKSGKQPPNFYRELWKTVKDGRVWQGEMINKRKDGSLYTEEQTITPVTDSAGNITHFIAIKLDISDRKAAESAIAEKTRALETVAEFERTQSKVMTLFNSYSDTDELFNQMLNVLAESHQMHMSAVYLIDEWHGRLNCVASYGLPEKLDRDIALGKGFIGQAAKSEKTLIISKEQDIPIKINTGLFDITPAMIIALPITHSNKTLGILVLASIKSLDQNEVGFLERLAKQVGVSLNNQTQYQHLKALSEQLKNRGKEVSQKNAQLEQNNKLKTEFLANMSHELRTPLNAIIGFSEVLKDELLGTLNEEQRDYVEEVFDSANHLLSLINDILDLSKIEAGKMELSIESANINEIIRNSISIIKEKAHNHNITTTININDSIGCARIDSRKFKQILFNLLSNAVKFTPDGGSIRVDSYIEDNILIVAISDTGIGIAKEKIDLLFQPFVQLDGSLSRHHEGTGLGLAMVKRLAELHNGTVSIESEVGKGSCFTLSIPYIEDSGLINDLDESGSFDNFNDDDKFSPERPQSEPVTPSATDAGNRSINHSTINKNNAINNVLIIESDKEIGERFGNELTSAGYGVHHAHNEETALRKAKAIKPDLIVLDLMIRDAEGWSFIHKIKQHDELKNIPIASVAISADKGIPLGTVDVLQKPIRKSNLIEAISTKIDRGKEHATILMVENKNCAINFLVEQLQDAGFATQTARTGMEALKLIRLKTPDLIILDLMMPGMSGFEVVAKIRQNESTREIPVIIITAKTLSQKEKDDLDTNIHEIVNKCQFKTDRFISLIHENLSDITEATKNTIAPTEADRSALILVVEENAKQSELLSLYFLDAGYRVKIAHDGITAIKLMRQEKPDLITLNLLTNEINSGNFLETKRQINDFANIPVIVISGSSKQDRNAVISADAVLSKPIQRSEILSLAQRLAPLREAANKLRTKVLLIDDDPKAIKIVSSYLPDKDYEIVTALSGTEGLTIVKSDQPDLIILDLMMPEMNGFEVLSKLKQSYSSSNIPVIVLTAKLLTNAEVKKLKAHVEAVAEKGRTNKESLSTDVNRILGRYHTL